MRTSRSLIRISKTSFDALKVQLVLGVVEDAVDRFRSGLENSTGAEKLKILLFSLSVDQLSAAGPSQTDSYHLHIAFGLPRSTYQGLSAASRYTVGTSRDHR